MVIRDVLATANRIETIQSNSESIVDFFLAPLVNLYPNLCENCLKLFFESEFKLEHFRRAEDVLWKRVYHDAYRLRKNKRVKADKNGTLLLEAHFMSGIGFYSGLIIKLRTHYNIDRVENLINPLNLLTLPLDNVLESHKNSKYTWNNRGLSSLANNVNQEQISNTPAKQWARQAIYRSLVYMGDLARYMLEVSHSSYKSLAFSFYKTAALFEPNFGLPLNQIGTLTANRAFNLNSTFNYICCCMRPKPFEGAEGNMNKLFEINRKSYNELVVSDNHSTISQVLGCEDPSEGAKILVQRTVVIFLNLVSSMWLLSNKDDADLTDHDGDELVINTKRFFEHLREALEIEPLPPFVSPDCIDEGFCPLTGYSEMTKEPRYMSALMIYELNSISVMLSARYYTNSKSNKHLDFFNTLTLNLFHYITTACQKLLINKIQEKRIQLATAYLEEQTKSSNDTLSSRANIASSKKSLSRIRQKKAASNYCSSLLARCSTSSYNLEESDLSELEETALSTIDALDIGSDVSEETETHASDLIDFGSSSEDVSGCLLASSDANIVSTSGILMREARSQKSDRNEFKEIFNELDDSPFEPNEKDGENNIDSKHCNGRNVWLNIENSDMIPKKTIKEPGSYCQFARKKLSQDFLECMSFIYNQTYLPSIKIVCDWLLANDEIIKTNEKSFLSFKNELAILVKLLRNLLNLLDADVDIDDSVESSNESRSSLSDFEESRDFSVYNHVYNGTSWNQKYPLSVDLPFMNVIPLKNVHDLNIDFKICRKLNDSESGFLTIQCVVAFSQALEAFFQK